MGEKVLNLARATAICVSRNAATRKRQSAMPLRIVISSAPWDPLYYEGVTME